MEIYRKEKRTFKNGEKHHLDSVYSIMGLFPDDHDNPFYYQDDIGDLSFAGGSKSRDGSDNDCGEYVKILRNFTIEFTIKVGKS